MKVCILAPEFLPPLGGVGSYSVELVKNLCRDPELDVHVVTPKRGRNYDRKKVLKFFDEQITLHNISVANDTFFYNLKFQLGILKHFKKLNKKEKFDLVHSANLVHMPDIYLKFRKINVPSLATIHTSIDSQSTINENGDGNGSKNGEKMRVTNRAFSEIFSSLFYFYIKSMEHHYLERTQHFIAVSNWIKENILNGSNGNGSDINTIKHYTHTNIKVVHNGVDLKRFSPEVNEEFSEFDSIEKIKILYTGRLLAMKGLNTLIDSMKLILDEMNKDVYFIFAGIGNTKQWKKIMNKKRIPEDHYTFLGYVPYEKINLLYNKVDIFVLPSLTESCPITLLEAMASGLPIIASNVGGIPEIIENNETGILVQPRDSRKLAEKISLLMENRMLTRKLSFKARKLVERKFNANVMAKKTKKVYVDILETNA
jgi:glycosyltransferase involved in cell wall biosynthesis